jgi:hypothetical protein
VCVFVFIYFEPLEQNVRIPFSGGLRIFCAISCAAALLVWRFYLLDATQARSTQALFGFWMVLAVVCVWGSRAWRDLRSPNRATDWGRQDGVPLMIVLACAVFLQIHEPHRLRVVNDEPAHIATSMMMYEEGMVAAPGRTHFLDDEILHTSIIPTIRMYLFPTLLSLLHAVAGYRVETVFILNGYWGYCCLRWFISAGEV